jgi:magnesium-transporting ATPase (P-type)
MDPDKYKSPETPHKPKGYGKRPIWQWILLYVIIAIVVYGLIYLIFIHKSGNSGNGTGSSGYTY